MILRNLHCRFVLCSAGQIYGGDFAKFCGLLRIYTNLKSRLSEGTTKFEKRNPLLRFDVKSMWEIKLQN